MDWISIKDEFPKKGVIVLGLSPQGVFHCWWDDVSSSCDWYDTENCWIIENVTHWRPLSDYERRNDGMD